jgi:hypothetical protein
MRQAIVFGPTFPSAARVTRFEYTWGEIEAKVKMSQNSGLYRTLLKISTDPQQKKRLITYVSVRPIFCTILTCDFQSLYARSSLMSEIGSKARTEVKSFFSFKGTPEEITETVKWLALDGNFTFGNVDCKVSLLLFFFLFFIYIFLESAV